MLNKLLGRLHIVSAVAACVLVVPAGQAQEGAGAADLAEVVVTARKREETLFEVPISVQAISERELRAAGIVDLKGLQTVAGFAYPQQSGTAAGGRTFGVLIFRGLAGDGGQAFENSGALFVDGVFISGGVATVNTTDVERVEVLKGPQNAYFGRSTFGGAINMITRNPASEFGARVNAELTDRGTANIDLLLEGPLFSDKLRGRLAFVSNNKAG